MKTKISRMVGNPAIPFLMFFVIATLSMGVVQAASVSIDPVSKSVNGSDTFSVNIVVNPAGQAVMGTQVKLSFDKSVVSLNSAVPGTFLGSSPVQFAKTIDNANGIVELSYTVAGGDTAKTASGTFATLTFTVKSNAPTGNSNLDLTMAKLTDSNADLITGVTMNDGTITVSPAPGSGSSGGGNPAVRIEPASISANPADTFSVNVGVYPAGNAVMGTQIKLSFNKSVLNLTSAVPGTFLGNNPVQFVKNIDNTNGTLELGYTVAGGGSAKTANGTFATLTYTVKSNAPNGTSNIDITLAKLTNATADPISGVTMNDGTVTVSSAPVIVPGNPAVRIEPASINANRSDTFSVNVGVYPAGNAIMGTQIKLSFNKSVLNLSSAVPGTFLGTSPVQFSKTIDNANGTLELGYTVAGGDTAKTANGTFAILTFTVKSDAPNGNSSLDLTLSNLTNATAYPISGVIMTDGIVIVNQGSVIPPVVDGAVWKFLTVPFELENSSVENVLKGVNYSMIYAWDPVGKKPVTPVTNLKPLNGYIIRVNDSAQQITNLVRKSGPYTPSSLAVYTGWNLIGTSGTNPMSASMNLQPIDTSYYGILNWNVPAQKYDTIGINRNTIPPGTVSTDVFIMQPKESYWVWATANTSMPANLVP